MIIQDIHLEVPKRIVSGIASGEMQRFGGVVRSRSGEIVAHLREVGRARAASGTVTSALGGLALMQGAMLWYLDKRLANIHEEVRKSIAISERIEADLRGLQGYQIVSEARPFFEGVHNLTEGERHGDHRLLERALDKFRDSRAILEQVFVRHDAVFLLEHGHAIERLLKVATVLPACELQAHAALSSERSRCTHIIEESLNLWKTVASTLDELEPATKRMPTKAMRDGVPDRNPYKTARRWLAESEQCVELLEIEHELALAITESPEQTRELPAPSSDAATLCVLVESPENVDRP